MNEYKTAECKGCESGVKMCQNRPFWGTPDDIDKIIDVGYANDLMLEYYDDEELNGGEEFYFMKKGLFGF